MKALPNNNTVGAEAQMLMREYYTEKGWFIFGMKTVYKRERLGAEINIILPEWIDLEKDTITLSGKDINWITKQP